jgi:GTP cyclohydrolase II
LQEADKVSCRIHSECLTGEVLGSLKCDCKQQLDFALKTIQSEGVGILLYMRQEGRGIGLGNKIRAYALQEKGADTVDANRMLGFPDDAREYLICGDMLKALGVRSVRLMTNNPNKLKALRDAGIDVEHVPAKVSLISKEASDYLSIKHSRMGHLQ